MILAIKHLSVFILLVTRFHRYSCGHGKRYFFIDMKYLIEERERVHIQVRTCTYRHELPFADGRRIGRSWRTTRRDGPIAREVDVRTPRQHSESSRSFLVVSARLVPRSVRPHQPERKRCFYVGPFAIHNVTVEKFRQVSLSR